MEKKFSEVLKFSVSNFFLIFYEARSHKKSIDANIALKKTWDEKMQRKKEQNRMVEINRKMREEKGRKLKAEDERLKKKAARKELNTFKSASFQIVRNFFEIYVIFLK